MSLFYSLKRQLSQLSELRLISYIHNVSIADIIFSSILKESAILVVQAEHCGATYKHLINRYLT
jgi:hypothetical protein